MRRYKHLLLLMLSAAALGAPARADTLLPPIQNPSLRIPLSASTPISYAFYLSARTDQMLRIGQDLVPQPLVPLLATPAPTLNSIPSRRVPWDMEFDGYAARVTFSGPVFALAANRHFHLTMGDNDRWFWLGRGDPCGPKPAPAKAALVPLPPALWSGLLLLGLTAAQRLAGRWRRP